MKVRGHTKSVTVLQLSDFTFASGDASGAIRLWELMKPAALGGTAAPGNEIDSSKKYSRCRCMLKAR